MKKNSTLKQDQLRVMQQLVRELGVYPKYRNSKHRPPKSMWRDWEIYFKKRLDEEMAKLTFKGTSR